MYLAVDSLIPTRGKPFPGLDEFSASLDHSAIPVVWVTDRTRLQMDAPRRTNGHTHPFIGEGGCAVFLPEDYFHLRPAKTLRLGRFTSIPITQPQPAAQEALASLAEDTGIDAVPLRSLSPRELVQNSGLPARDAEMARQRDFDELFFFAGATDAAIARFVAEAQLRRLALRRHGMLWSLAVGASLQRCIRDLAKLYDRALRYHAVVLGVATAEEAPQLFPCCERNILLAKSASPADESHRNNDEQESAEQDNDLRHDDGQDNDGQTDRDNVEAEQPETQRVRAEQPDFAEPDHARQPSAKHRRTSLAKDPKLGTYSLTIPLRAPETWERLLEAVGSRSYK